MTVSPQKNSLSITILLVLSVIWAFLHCDKYFFWDNIVQLSVPANWYFENGISKFFLPDEITTGHPKFAGLYLSLIWKIFGKNIAVSHWALSPFVYGLVYQLFMFIKTYVARNQREAIIIL